MAVFSFSVLFPLQQLCQHLTDDLRISLALCLLHHLTHQCMECILIAVLIVVYDLLALAQNFFCHGTQYRRIADLLKALCLKDLQ